MDNSPDFFLKAIITLSSDNLKYALFHLGAKISDFTNLKKHMFVV